ncbi:MAG: hypothetical protein QM756_02735 [Polyangiaceae bacterium]
MLGFGGKPELLSTAEVISQRLAFALDALLREWVLVRDARHGFDESALVSAEQHVQQLNMGVHEMHSWNFPPPNISD